jgi:hypothetical protein
MGLGLGLPAATALEVVLLLVGVGFRFAMLSTMGSVFRKCLGCERVEGQTFWEADILGGGRIERRMRSLRDDFGVRCFESISTSYKGGEKLEAGRSTCYHLSESTRQSLSEPRAPTHSRQGL